MRVLRPARDVSRTVGLALMPNQEEARARRYHADKLLQIQIGPEVQMYLIILNTDLRAIWRQYHFPTAQRPRLL